MENFGEIDSLYLQDQSRARSIASTTEFRSVHSISRNGESVSGSLINKIMVNLNDNVSISGNGNYQEMEVFHKSVQFNYHF